MANTRKYAGATSRIKLDTARNYSANWVAQPKLDGAYCVASLDANGAIEGLHTRRGKAFAQAIAGDLLGCIIGAPNSVLVGELEAHTEAGNRAAEARGYRLLHLFDALAINGQALEHEPYRVRRSALQRSRAQLELKVGNDAPWKIDAHNRAHGISDGRFRSRIPNSWKRAPIVEQRPIKLIDELWGEYVLEQGGEGIVAVNLDAPVGARSAKRKIKDSSSLDCVALDVGAKVATFHHVQTDTIFTCSLRSKVAVTPNQIYEIAHDGFYDSGLPRFPRIKRERLDLAPITPLRSLIGR